ncbi:hypothetical protein DSECCO2_223960 [anaerobic digester metagenome]
MFENYDDVVDVSTVCKMLKIGKTSCYELVKENKIKSFKIKNKILIAKQDVITFVENERRTA